MALARLEAVAEPDVEVLTLSKEQEGSKEGLSHHVKQSVRAVTKADASEQNMEGLSHHVKQLVRAVTEADASGVAIDAQLAQFFKLYDHDGSGGLSHAELKHALKLESGGTLSDAEIEGLLESADKDGDRTLDVREFRRLLLKLGHIRHKRHHDAIRTRAKDYSGKNECTFMANG